MSPPRHRPVDALLYPRFAGVRTFMRLPHVTDPAALAELRALAVRHGPMALVQLDSHTDTWEAYFDQPYFHGTTFKRAAEEGLIEPGASVQAGMRGSLYGPSDLEDARALGFQVIQSEELRALGPDGYARAVRARVGDRPVFFSFDIDFLDPA